MNEIEQTQPTNWRRRIFIIGGLSGTLLGFLSAYLYARAAEEDAERTGGKLPSVATRELLGIGLALLTLIRQITELGKPDKSK